MTATGHNKVRCLYDYITKGESYFISLYFNRNKLRAVLKSVTVSQLVCKNVSVYNLSFPSFTSLWD